MRHAIISALFLLVSILWLALWQVWALDQDKFSLEKYTDPTAETEVPADSVPAVPSLSQQADRLVYEITVIKERNRMYSVFVVMAVGLLSLITVLFVITRRATCTANHTISAAGLTLIIFGTITLVLVVDVDEQLSASIGIMGVLAGYLFGRMSTGQDKEASQSGPAQSNPP